MLKQPNDKYLPCSTPEVLIFPLSLTLRQRPMTKRGSQEMLFESGQPIEGADELSLPGMAGGGQHSGVVPIAGQRPPSDTGQSSW